MARKPHATIKKHFKTLQDPRTGNATEHVFLDILVITLCAVICGADGWTEVQVWGEANQKWLRTFLELPSGIPSHDTFGRVFAQIDPEEFGKCFRSWIQAISKLTHRQVVAVDGKKLRRSLDRPGNKKAIWMVSAWASANQAVWGQTKIRAKSNEIKAIPELLRLLELTGCIVTIDAIGCQTKIAEQIVRQGADYVLAVKENQGKLFEDLRDLFAGYLAAGFPQVPHDYAREVGKDHGRLEIRECWTVADPDSLAFVRRAGQWPKLQTLVMLRAERQVNGKRSAETRYYISSLENNAAFVLQSVRAHWGIENKLHWVLDVAFREDESRIRKDHAPENMAIVRHMALNLLKRETTAKIGIKAKRFKANCDRTYLRKVLRA